MVKNCCVCAARCEKGTTLTFHSFPKDIQRRLLWQRSLKMPELAKSSYVCSKHFYPNFLLKQNGRTYIKHDAIPCITVERSLQYAEIDKSVSSTTINEDINHIVKLEIFEQPLETMEPSENKETESFPVHTKEETSEPPAIIDPPEPYVKLEIFAEPLETMEESNNSAIELEKSFLVHTNEKTIVPAVLDPLEQDVKLEIFAEPLETMEQCTNNTTELEKPFPVHTNEKTSVPTVIDPLEQNVNLEIFEQPLETMESSENNTYEGSTVPAETTPCECISGTSNNKPQSHRRCSLIRYIGDATVEHFSTPYMASKNLELIKKIYYSSQKELKILRQDNKRLRAKINTLNGLLKHS